MLILFLGLVSLVVLFIFFWLSFGNLSVTSVTWVPMQKIPQAMTLTLNPFVFKINNRRTASLSGVECVLSSEVKWSVQALWGVPLSDLFKTLSKDWLTLKDEIQHNILLEDKCLSRSIVKHEYACNEEIQVFTPTRVIQGHQLGKNLRLLYPLVVFMIREEDNGILPNQEQVVAMISIVHVKDELIKLETHVINQYLKLSNNHLCCLMVLYMPSDADRNSSSLNNAEETLCVVCQTNPVTVICLPCRHVCICQVCFQKLEKCPMCRASIQSYFALDGTPRIVNDVEEGIMPLRVSLTQFFGQLNDRLNHWFGFN